MLLWHGPLLQQSNLSTNQRTGELWTNERTGELWTNQRAPLYLVTSSLALLGAGDVGAWQAHVGRPHDGQLLGAAGDQACHHSGVTKGIKWDNV